MWTTRTIKIEDVENTYFGTRIIWNIISKFILYWCQYKRTLLPENDYSIKYSFSWSSSNLRISAMLFIKELTLIALNVPIINYLKFWPTTRVPPDFTSLSSDLDLCGDENCCNWFWKVVMARFWRLESKISFLLSTVPNYYDMWNLTDVDPYSRFFSAVQ